MKVIFTAMILMLAIACCTACVNVSYDRGFEAGTKSISVQNSEPILLDEVSRLAKESLIKSNVVSIYPVAHKVLRVEAINDSTLKLICISNCMADVSTDELTSAGTKLYMMTVSYSLDSRVINDILADTETTAIISYLFDYQCDNNLVLEYCGVESGTSWVGLNSLEKLNNDTYKFASHFTIYVYSDGWCTEYLLTVISPLQLTSSKISTALDSILTTGSYEDCIISFTTGSLRPYIEAGGTFILN